MDAVDLRDSKYDKNEHYCFSFLYHLESGRNNNGKGEEGGKEYKNNKDNERYGYGYIYIYLPFRLNKNEENINDYTNKFEI